jgi:ElaB/YqjD/DUF883 family membrane-anchored ribosome-binding protein
MQLGGVADPMSSSELLKLKSQMTSVAKDAASMAAALDQLRRRLEGAVAATQAQIHGTSQQARYAQMIQAYESAAQACVTASGALIQAGRRGKEIGDHL